MATDEKKKISITLTGRPPVKVDPEKWPVIAAADGDSYRGSDYGRHQQALAQGECDEYKLRVRQHEDGRTLVYGVLSAAISAWHAPAGGEDWRGGVLLTPPLDPSNIADAIRRIGEEGQLPDSVIRECIANLPAEEL